MTIWSLSGRVRWGRDPRETLRPGSRIDTTIAGIGILVTRVEGW